jgi:DNA replication protein DnaC
VKKSEKKVAGIAPSKPEPSKPEADLDEVLLRVGDIVRQARARRKELEVWVARNAAKTVTCKEHAETLQVDMDETSRQSTPGNIRVVYRRCPICAAIEDERKMRTWLERRGVPKVLTHCTLENLNMTSAAHREAVLEASHLVNRTGFLVLVGEAMGVGKTHIAVGTLRLLGEGQFTTHADLLLALRRTYRRDSWVLDVIEQAKRTTLLVLDDVQTFGGGDEALMLQSILYDRIGGFKRTVLTANVKRGQLPALLGPRLTDRLTECASVVELSGKSHRIDRRASYGS